MYLIGFCFVGFVVVGLLVCLFVVCAGGFVAVDGCDLLFARILLLCVRVLFWDMSVGSFVCGYVKPVTLWFGIWVCVVGFGYLSVCGGFVADRG